MQLALYRYSLPFRQPLMFKRERLANREGLLVSINGQWGEIAPLPGFSTETLAEAEAESLACLAALSRGEIVSPTLPSVQFGFDCVQRSWPLNLPEPLPPYPLLQGAPAALIQSLSTTDWQASLPSRLKLKVARHAMEEELALIEQLAARLPTTKLILDANGGWTREPTLIGSLSDCEALVQRARAGNLRVVVSSSFESDLGLVQLARLASEWAPDEPPGLDTGHWLAGRVTNLAGEVMTENVHCLSKMENLA